MEAKVYELIEESIKKAMELNKINKELEKQAKKYGVTEEQYEATWEALFKETKKKEKERG